MQTKLHSSISPLLPPAVALVAGILAARYFEFFPFTITILCLAACAGIMLARRLKLSMRISACIFLAVGFASFFLYGPGAPSFAGDLARRGNTEVAGVVASAPQERDGYTVIHLRPLGASGCFRRAGLIRLTVSGTGLNIRYGDRITGILNLRQPSGLRNPGAFDWGSYARLTGIDAVASASPGSLRCTGNTAGPVMGRVHSLRRALIDRAQGSLGYPAGAIFRAVILGDQGGVDQAMRDAFKASGTTHILSVSGSHIALLSGAVFFGVEALFGLLPAGWAIRLSLVLDIKKLAAALTIPAAVSYCLIAGSEVATVRATIMVCIFLVSVLIDRQNQVLNTLSAAALVVLLLDPSALFDISFRLSYLAVLFIAMALYSVRGLKLPDVTGRPRLDGIIRNAALACIMSAAAIAGTAPLVAGQFNSFSYVALPANLILLPLAGALAVPAGLLSCLVYALAPGDGLPLAWLNEICLGAFHAVVKFFSSAPSADLHPASPGQLVALAYYAAAIAALSWRAAPAKKAAALLLVAAAFAAAGMYRPGADGMRVCFLDCGQGDCAVVELPDGGTMLIDCGGPPVGADPGRAAAAPYLWDRGIRYIEYVVVSHPQPDHISGLAYILDNFGVGQLWEGGLVSDGRAYISLREAAAAKGVPRFVLPEKSETNIGGITVQSLHAALADVDDADCGSGTRINNRSLVVRLAYGEVSFLFTGDAETQAQQAMLDGLGSGPLNSSVLKVPHHGSADACLPGFIAAVSPEVAVISAGRSNRFGHPGAQTLETLRAAGAGVYCTPFDGAVTVTTDGRSIHVDTFEGGRLRPASGWRDELANMAKLASP